MYVFTDFEQLRFLLPSDDFTHTDKQVIIFVTVVSEVGFTDVVFLGCDVVCIRRLLPASWRNILPSSSGL